MYAPEEIPQKPEGSNTSALLIVYAENKAHFGYYYFDRKKYVRVDFDQPYIFEMDCITQWEYAPDLKRLGKKKKM